MCEHRTCDAARARAHRGELRISVPMGYIWHREIGSGFGPDMRLQETIRLIFEQFRKLGSGREVLLSLAADGVRFPQPSDGKKLVSFGGSYRRSGAKPARAAGLRSAGWSARSHSGSCAASSAAWPRTAGACASDRCRARA